jgi:hypothetical protein
MVMVLAPAASAQYESGFEAPTYTGSPGGTLATGQDGWYLPPVGGLDESVYTYTDNALGFPANPTGGDQFMAGVTGANVCRAQHDNDFSAGDEWELSYDIAAKYTGNFPAAINLASFSMQDSTKARFFISLNNFEDPNTCTTWKAEYNVYGADGGALNNQSPGAAWTGLASNHWYRLSTSVNFATNQVNHVRVTDLDTGSTTEADVNWYLTGGSNPTLPLPTAVRCFVGGSAGDTAGYDNVEVKRAGGPPPCYADCDGDKELSFFDFLCYTNAFNAGDTYADCDGDGELTFFDFLCYTNLFNKGC